MTRLSVVIAARNEERHLPEQLLAIQTQAVRPDEIVLTDDGSTDRTLEIMQAFAASVPGVRIIVNEESVGATAAQNRGVYESTGDWIYDASANDVIQPGAFAAFADALRLDPDTVLVTGDLAGLPLGWTARPARLAPQTVAALLGGRGIIHGAATFVRRDAWDECGGWPSDIGGYADALMWHVLGCRYGLTYTPHPIAWVRPNEPGRGNGAVALDPNRRRPYLEAFARHVLALEEPTRSRLVGSGLWEIREFAPEMAPLLSRPPTMAGVVG